MAFLQRIIGNLGGVTNVIGIVSLALSGIAIFAGLTNREIRCLLKLDPSEKCANKITITVSGSTSMVDINQEIKINLPKVYPNTIVDLTDPTGSEEGIKDVLSGKANIAAVSRELNDDEKKKLSAVGIGRDKIAVVVGKDNPVKHVTIPELKKIFQGDIRDWSKIDSKSSNTIKVFNRSSKSGTYKTFQHLVLRDEEFGSGGNIITWPKDQTIPILSQLKNTGITYATYNQVVSQQTVHVLGILDPINSKYTWPPQKHYPLFRELYYVYLTKDFSQPEVQRWIEYIKRSEGRDVIQHAMEEP